MAERVDEEEDPHRQLQLANALEEKELAGEVDLVSEESGLPLYNLAQFYIHNEPHQKLKIIYWLKALLKNSQLNEDGPMFDEALVTLALLHN